MKNFQHVTLTSPLPELSTENVNGQRFYLVPDGNYYPSITTVLSLLSAPSIAKWKARVGLTEANRISQAAATRGTQLHATIEDYLNNRAVRFPNDPKSRVKIMFNSLRPRLDHINNIAAQEIPLYSDDLMIAGRCDCIAEFDGVLSIVDFKSSSKAKKREWIEGYFIQTAAYALMFEERTGIPIHQLVILMCGEEDFSCQLFVEQRSNFEEKLREVIDTFIETQLTVEASGQLTECAAI